MTKTATGTDKLICVFTNQQSTLRESAYSQCVGTVLERIHCSQ